MKHDDCTDCGLAVLELDGQYELMQGYEIQNDEIPFEQAGAWHTACLVSSPVGPGWAAVRLRTYRDIRKYAVVAELDAWTVLGHERGDKIAIGKTGELLGLRRLGSKKKARPVLAGRVFPRLDEGYNLDVKDERAVDAIREGFAASGSYPLLSAFELLGIRERVHHPVALERAIVSGVRASESRHFITMTIEYGVFVPDELLPFTGGAPA